LRIPGLDTCPTPAIAFESRDSVFHGGHVPAITADKLPPEARVTIAIIDQGGTFPHPNDGAIFKNLEGRLPPQPTGYYREYTVETPGAPDRGARRIVVGGGGERYYTDDHYGSFVRIE
jgi:ribonuclease T1